MAYLPDGSLLVTIEHEGRFHLGGDDIGSSEVGLGLISANGQIVDVSNTNGVIYWLIVTQLKYQERPRINVLSVGSFYLVADGPTYDTNRRAAFIQPFDAAGNSAGNPFVPHYNDSPPQNNHAYPDIASNGTIYLVAWQNGRMD